MNTVPLNVLIDAVKTIEMLREVARSEMTTDQYMQSLRSWSSFGAYVDHISKQINIEVQA